MLQRSAADPFCRQVCPALSVAVSGQRFSFRSRFRLTSDWLGGTVFARFDSHFAAASLP